MPIVNGLTLQQKVSVAVVVGLAIGLGLLSLLGVQSVDASIQRTLDERLTMARLVAAHMDETISDILTHTQNAANSRERPPVGEDFAPTAKSLQAELAASGISVRSILLLNKEGDIIVARPEGPVLAGLTTVARFPGMTEALRAELSTVSGLISIPTIDVPLILAVAPIYDGQGNNMGALASLIEVNRSSIIGLAKPITLGNTGYTEIIDKSGLVVARSEPLTPATAQETSDHPGRFAELIAEGKATRRTCHRCHGNEDQPMRRKDILAFAPLSTIPWGVAIRQSEEEALAPAEQLRQRFLLLGAIILVGGLLMAWIMIQGLVRPIKILTVASKRVAAGDFRVSVPVKGRDELGQLSAAFSAMTQQLAKSREELLRRNEELSVLNSVAVTVSQSLKLDDVLKSAIRKVLEITKASVGSVFLLTSDGKRLRMMSSIGPPSIFDCKQFPSPTSACACHQVLKFGRAMMVTDISQCPILDQVETADEGINSFISVPLRSKDRALGVMNVACSSERCITEKELAILDSIGHHMSLAIENSILYEEARQREELRGQLLTKVISAQEEERKRIAREIHDEFGQTLTGIIMGIESIEAAASAKQSRLREKLAHTRSQAVRALDEMRKLTLGLRPSVLDDLGLVAAVRSYTQPYLQSMGINLDFQIDGFSGRLDPAVETALFRIIQEAVHNIAKHAGAKSARIRLEAKDGKMVAVVEDDGSGFDVDDVLRTGSRPQSLGILGIRERTTFLGGTFDIKSQVGKGTRLTVEIPINGSIQYQIE